MRIQKPITFLLIILASCSPAVTFAPAKTIIPTARFNPTSISTHRASITSTPFVTPTITQLPPLALLDVFQPVSGATTWQWISANQLLVAEIETKTQCVHDGQYGLRLTYSPPQQKVNYEYGAWGIEWEHVINITNNAQIAFWVKGINGRESFFLEIYTDTDYEPRLRSDSFVQVSNVKWQKVNVPLKFFIGGPNSAKITGLWRFVFSFDTSIDKAESICIDGIALLP